MNNETQTSAMYNKVLKRRERERLPKKNGSQKWANQMSVAEEYEHEELKV